MEKVIDYLDKTFYHEKETERSNDSRTVGFHGDWIYPFPKDQIMFDTEPSFGIVHTMPENFISCMCNNRRLIVRVFLNKKYVDNPYFNTYPWFPDEQKQTDEYIIDYLKKYKKEIDKIQKLDREDKLRRILDVDE